MNKKILEETKTALEEKAVFLKLLAYLKKKKIITEEVYKKSIVKYERSHI